MIYQKLGLEVRVSFFFILKIFISQPTFSDKKLMKNIYLQSSPQYMFHDTEY